MAFLDNSGDIILDAVLTDTGRKRLARGDGSFRIANYAFADDEINYALYDRTHASGSAYYDLEILKTPVLESFTNNMSSMKSKLLSISRTNLLYLPIVTLNRKSTDTRMFAGADGSALSDDKKNLFVVAVDQDTVNAFQQNPNNPEITAQYDESNVHIGRLGVISGIGSSTGFPAKIQLDQGLDTLDIPPTFGLDADLVENQYIIEIDNRLGYIVGAHGTGAARPSVPNYIDDDDIASYIITNADANYISDNIETALVADTGSRGPNQVIRGPRGTTLEFKVLSSIELQSSTFLFQKMGTAVSATTVAAGGIAGIGFKHYYIDTNVRVTGITTGYSIDIPIRFVKLDFTIS